jgi:basic membrane lipoprotein Med (substrate-binding protein (PBP1-ABC) superfamily)
MILSMYRNRFKFWTLHSWNKILLQDVAAVAVSLIASTSTTTVDPTNAKSIEEEVKEKVKELKAKIKSKSIEGSKWWWQQQKRLTNDE